MGAVLWLDRESTKSIAKRLTRMMRVVQEVMYPKEAKVESLVWAVLKWETDWNNMMKEQEGAAAIPEVWRMAALSHLWPKEIKAHG